MKKQFLTIVMIAAFFLCLTAPNLLFPFLQTEADRENLENRSLAAFPTLSADTLGSFPSSMEQYLGDHAAFRNRFLTLNSLLNLKLFGHADSTQVLKGKDGWYFYTAGASMENYLGINPFSEPDLERIAAKVSQVQEALDARGIQLVILLAPSKEGIYSEYLPDDFHPASAPTQREQLVTCLQERTSVPIVDPYPLLKNSRDEQWFYKTDTHWNDAGGFVASQLLIETVGGTPTPLSQVNVSYVPREMGDLAKLFHMPEAYNEETQAVLSGYYDSLVTQFEDPDGNGNIVHLATDQSPDPRRIAVYRDSFGTALSPFLSKYFRQTDFYHWQAYTPALIEENPPDLLIYEVVEREEGRILDDMEKLLPR